MRTWREVLASVHVDGTRLAHRFADLLVVERADGSTDWECVVVTDEQAPLELQPVRVRLAGHDDRVQHGDAIVVRSDGESHVLRGVGPLETERGDPRGRDADDTR